jgi:outer membrane protein TolC
MPVKASDGDLFTLSQAVSLGLRINPQIRAAQSAVESARQYYNSQRAPINPTFDYAALNNTVAPASWSAGFSSGYNYSMYVTLETNGAMQYRASQSKEQYHQAQFDAATTGLSLKLGIISAYVGVQVANRALEVEMKVYDNVRKLTDLTEKRFQSGAGPEADFTRAKIAEITEMQNVIADVSNVNLARATLNSQLGRPQSAPVDVAEPLSFQHVSIASLSDLTKQAENDRPEFKSAKANLASLHAAIGLERSAFFPDVVLGRDFGGDGLTYIGFSVPLDLGGISGSVAKAKADFQTQEAQVELQRQNIDLDVKSSYENFVAAQKQVDTYDSGIMKLSELLVDEVHHGYELGANTILDILTAENTYRAVESAYYAALGSYLEAAYTLKHSIGALPDSFTGTDLDGIGAFGFTPPVQQLTPSGQTPAATGPVTKEQKPQQ